MNHPRISLCLLLVCATLLCLAQEAPKIPAHTVVDLRPYTNMGLADEKPDDGVGGWSDQGPDQDGRAFAPLLKEKLYNGVPFEIHPEGKCVLAMNDKDHFRGGPVNVDIPLPKPAKARALFMLHTGAWLKIDAGHITVKDTQGHQKQFEVKGRTDLGDWFGNGTRVHNGIPVVIAKNNNLKDISIYLSRFVIPEYFGPIASIHFTTKRSCIWLILGATLTEEVLPMPEYKELIIQKGDEWQPVQWRPNMYTIPGSALDRSGYLPKKTTDELGHLIRKGEHFYLENQPERPARFLVNAFHGDKLAWISHKVIDAWTREMWLNGYNMIRPHFLDMGLMLKSEKDLEFNLKVLDNFDYLVFQCKKYGIYMMFDAMTSWIGYQAGDMWSVQWRNHANSYKWRINFEQKVKDNWSQGVEKLLTHVNPYTQTRLVDDPILGIAIAYNEQEFGFMRTVQEPVVGPHWRKFLKDKYGTIEALRQAWGVKDAHPATFDEIPVWDATRYGGVNGNDAAIFVCQLESDLMRWYISEFRRIGFQGPVTGFNCGKSTDHCMRRLDADFVASNSYHAHPSAWTSKDSVVAQKSSLESGISYFRGFPACRAPGKPFAISEHNICFWNQYRYEQGFASGAYSALQDFSAITAHAEAVNIEQGDFVPFQLARDPVMRANEFLTFFLFVRGDVKTARPLTRIQVREEEIYSPNGPKGGMPAEQSLLSLVGGLSLECIPRGGTPMPLRPNETAYHLGGTAKVIVGDAVMDTQHDAAASAEAAIRELKRRGILPKDNRSDGKYIFESETGELLMDTKKLTLEVNTPRLQGICAPAGTVASFPAFRVEKMSLKGNLAVVSIDGDTPIPQAKRLVLVYSTNALREGMAFMTDDMTTLVTMGGKTTLVQCGQFQVALKHDTPERLNLYPLDFAGKRLKQIAPVIAEDGWARFAVDMAKDGQAFFYEIAVE